MDEALMLSRMGTCEYIAHFRNVYLQELTIDGEKSLAFLGFFLRSARDVRFLGKQMFEVYIVTEYASGGDLFSVLRFV